MEYASHSHRYMMVSRAKRDLHVKCTCRIKFQQLQNFLSGFFESCENCKAKQLRTT